MMVCDCTRYCPQCGLGVKVDEDVCCVNCGCDTCPLEDLRRHLMEFDLHIVNSHDS